MLELLYLHLSLLLVFVGFQGLFLVRVVGVFNTIDGDVLFLQSYLLIKRAFLFFECQAPR